MEDTVDLEISLIRDRIGSLTERGSESEITILRKRLYKLLKKKYESIGASRKAEALEARS